MWGGEITSPHYLSSHNKQTSSYVKQSNIIMYAVLEFWNGQGRKVCIKRNFNDMKHMDNFIAYIKRTKGWMLDEAFYDEPLSSTPNQ
jgi:hypothetical protein